MSALRSALRDLPDPVFADVLESEGAYLVVLDMPGVAAEHLDVSTGAGTISVAATRTAAVPEGFTPVEKRRSTDLEFHLPLPPDADGDAVDGGIDGGVLELTIPKHGRGQRTTVPIDEA